MRIRFAFLWTTALAAMLVLGTGCEELDARRKVREANKLYSDAKYTDARKLYEEAIAASPDLDIAHHNLGVTLFKIMTRGDKSPENQAVAREAAEHLRVYLARHDEDEKVRKLMNDIWRDTGLYEEANAYWTERHAKFPDDTMTLEMLADIEYRRDDWRKAVDWLEKIVAVAKTDAIKADAHLKAGRLLGLKLREGRATIVGAERIQMVDRAIASLQKAELLQPKNKDIQGALATMNFERSFAEGARFAHAIDEANRQNYIRAFNVLKEEAKAQEAAKAAAEAAAAGNEQPAGTAE